METTVSECRNIFIETNGKSNIGDIEVIILNGMSNRDESNYEGSFLEIPESLLKLRVIELGQIVDSSCQERIGAITLLI